LIEQRKLRGHHADDGAGTASSVICFPIAAAELQISLRNGPTDDHDAARWSFFLTTK
jgi:hypothetical protein